MSRTFPAISVLLNAVVITALAAPVAPATAGTLEDFLNAPVWYLQYEVTFSSACQGTDNGAFGQTTFTSNLESGFSGTDVFNLRSGGPGPITQGEMMGTSDGSKPSAADAQKITMQMMSLMDHTANWMAGGPAMDPNATDADIAAAAEARFPAHIDYTRVDTGKDLVNEVGTRFDWTRTTTIQGSGLVLAGGMGVTLLEMDTAKKTYALQLPLVFNAMMARATRTTVDVTSSKGAAPDETRDSNDLPINQYPSPIELDQPQKGAAQGGVLIRGVLDPSSGKISGEQSFAAHYTEGSATAPGTYLVKYTLTLSKPQK